MADHPAGDVLIAEMDAAYRPSVVIPARDGHLHHAIGNAAGQGGARGAATSLAYLGGIHAVDAELDGLASLGRPDQQGVAVNHLQYFCALRPC